MLFLTRATTSIPLPFPHSKDVSLPRPTAMLCLPRANSHDNPACITAKVFLNPRPTAALPLPARHRENTSLPPPHSHEHAHLGNTAATARCQSPP